jgi:virginiamycin A acetyltransferase
MARKVLVVEVTSELLELLRTRRIYHRPYKEDRWKVGDRLRFPGDLRLEPFSHIHHGGNLPASLGAFSYVRSTLGPNVHIGRYCSIGADIRWLVMTIRSTGRPVRPFSTTLNRFRASGPILSRKGG